MEIGCVQFGIVDKRFLSKSVGMLNPPEPLVISELASVYEAISMLKMHRIGAVVITDRHGAISGIFSERDVVLKISLTDKDLYTTPVSEVMTRSPHTEKMTTTLAFALNLMSQGGYRHLPIVDDNRHPIGIISVKNIVDYIVRSLNEDLVQFS